MLCAVGSLCGAGERRGIIMKKTDVKKLAAAAMLVAAAVVGSMFSIPVGASKCSPVQHLVNIIGGVYLGPWYSLGMAFSASLIRNLLGLGSPLAFPGSMCGAFLSGFMYHTVGKKLCSMSFARSRDLGSAVRLPLAYAGELFGTSVIGGMLSYPVAAFIMGKEAALFTYVFPFFVSSLGGTLAAVVIVTAMKRIKFFDTVLGSETVENK